MSGKTISEKILSATCGADVRAGDVVMCRADLVIGTDASSPMAIDYFEAMGGTRFFDATRVMFAFDHYSPANTDKTRAFHERVRTFARTHGAALHDVGEGISFQRAIELGRIWPGALVIGADSHTVTCGALNAFATGVGSSDLAAAMITGEVWLRAPTTIKVVLEGRLREGVTAKDLALALVAAVGTDGANYQTLEFHGNGVSALSLEDRLVVCNLGVEMDAKASIFPADAATAAYLGPRGVRGATVVAADPDAQYARTVEIDLRAVEPQVALPHSPGNVRALAEALGTRVHMVFIGTCTGGRADDFKDALRVIERRGGRIADGVQLVLTPASREVRDALDADGTLARFASLGATITETGCGACCGTSGVIPRDGDNVLSTANRNFKARMGNASAAIYLASPIACAAAAVAGHIVDPRDEDQSS